MPGDLDWVGVGALSAWVSAVTETRIDDGIRVRPFGAHPHWKGVLRGKQTIAQLFAAWRSPVAGSDTCWAELELEHIYMGGEGVPSTYVDFLAELSAQLTRAGFAPVPSANAAAAPAGIRAALARWIKGR